MKLHALILLSTALLFSCSDQKVNESTQLNEDNSEQLKPLRLNLEHAERLVELPLFCIDIEYPNKLNQVIVGEEDLKSPDRLHPAFYGCFDWHSAVHGHWSLVKLAKTYPELKEKDQIFEGLLKHISKENIDGEIAYFQHSLSHNFERTYGWAWLLKLADELHTWNDPKARILEQNLKPLTDLIAERTIEFLPKLHYPIRVGTHTNTAFALCMIYDYALTSGNDELKDAVSGRAKAFYGKDVDCPLTWEPSGYDFLSPCLEEANIMRRVLPKPEFATWLDRFLPQLKSSDYKLAPGFVSDRSDGHLVHLDGLNFSRAWCLFGIAKTLPEDYGHLIAIGNEHIEYSLPNLVGDSYEGGHWLASFALLALSDE